MAEAATMGGRKTREMHNHHIDSTRWNGFPFRDDDIVIATWAKCGTTWMQQIIAQLIFQGREDVQAHALSAGDAHVVWHRWPKLALTGEQVQKQRLRLWRQQVRGDGQVRIEV